MYVCCISATLGGLLGYKPRLWGSSWVAECTRRAEPAVPTDEDIGQWKGSGAYDPQHWEMRTILPGLEFWVLLDWWVQHSI